MRFIFTILFIFSSLLACSQERTESDTIARVNDYDITVGDYLSLYRSLKPKDVELAGEEKQRMRNLVVQTLVRRAVILTNAERNNIQVSQDELNQAIENLKRGYSERLFRESLVEGMVEEDEWRERIKQGLLIEKIFEGTKPPLEKPTLEQALAYYQKHADRFKQPAEVLAQHIVVGDKDLASQLREQLKKNIRSWQTLARQHSTGPEAQDKAQIRVEKSTLPPPLDEALFGLARRQLSDVIETEYGYHLVRVLSRSDELNLDFDQVKAQILKLLEEESRQAEIDKLEEQLIRNAQIEYNRELIRSL